ncbi:MAG: hypothetical protein AABX70_04320 [Nanoarchaeota archaeon]
MNEVIKYDIGALADKEYRRISIGITPSNYVHLGFVFTLISAFMYMAKHSNSSLEVCITDRDVDPQLGRVFRPYHLLEDKDDACHGLISDHVESELELLRSDFCSFFHVDSQKVDIVFFNDLMKQETSFFGELKPFLLERDKSKRLKEALFDRSGKYWEVPFSPVCPDCGYSNSHLGSINRNTELLASACYKPGCVNEERNDLAVVSIHNPEAYNVHYMIPPARDVFDLERSPRADLHIFGGDFDREHGTKKIRKYERALNVMRLFSPHPPSIYIGPELRLGGQKISKSTGMFFPYVSNDSDFQNRFLKAAVQELSKGRNEVVDLALYTF